MKRLLGLLFAFAAAQGAEFAEIHVDASEPSGQIRMAFGVDAPADASQARLLVDRGFAGPVRLGPAAALRSELLDRLRAAWDDPKERAVYDTRHAAEQPAGPMVWTRQPSQNAVAEAAEALAYAVSLESTRGEAAYYKRRGDRWFDDDGAPVAALVGFDMAARLLDAPRKLRVRSDAKSITALAGLSLDSHSIALLLVRQTIESDETSEPAAVVAYIQKLPWGSSEFRVERYRLDADHDGALVQEGAGRGGLARVSSLFTAPAVELILLRKQDAPPGAGVIRRRTP